MPKQMFLCWLMCLFVLTPVGVLAGPSSRPVTQPTSRPATTPKPLCVDWKAMSADAFAKAATCFRKQREAAMIGLLRLARVQRNGKEISRLLKQLDWKTASPALLLAAAEAASVSAGLLIKHKALLQAACQLKQRPAHRFRAGILCSWLGLFKKLSPGKAAFDTCAKGCSQSHRFSFSFASNSPIIQASINGKRPALFIVDTGASTSVLTTHYAKQIGIPIDPKTRYKVNSPGGLINTYRALVTLRTGGLVLKQVPVSIIDLPIKFVAGIISPQTTWRHFAVEMDFRSFELSVSKQTPPTKGMVRLPLLFGGLNPVVFMSFAKRPALPFTLDTGATSTRLKESYDKLGTPLKRLFSTKTMAAGQKSTLTWPTKDEGPAHIGALKWRLIRPAIMQEVDANKYVDFKRYGLVGMDLLMGRKLLLDPAHKHLWISKQTKLSPWPVGAKATFTIKGAGFPAHTTVTETLVQRKKGKVVLAVTINRPGAKIRPFHLQMSDNWQNRGSWLLARPVEKAWDQKGPIGKRQLIRRWLSVFVGFRPMPKDVVIELRKGSLGGKTYQCTAMKLPALMRGGKGTLSITHCPKMPWRTARMAIHLLRNQQTPRLIWEYRRQGFVQ